MRPFPQDQRDLLTHWLAATSCMRSNQASLISQARATTGGVIMDSSPLHTVLQPEPRLLLRRRGGLRLPGRPH